MKLQLIFSQYFISNFNSISSQLYIKQLQILNLKTGIKTILNKNLFSGSALSANSRANQVGRVQNQHTISV